MTTRTAYPAAAVSVAVVSPSVALRPSGPRASPPSAGTLGPSVEALLAKADLRRFMEITVSNEDVKNPKPAPDPYLLACRWLDVEPHETLVVEDHDRGVQSAIAAGCHVVQLGYQKVNYLMVKQTLDGLAEPKRVRRP